MTLLLKLAPREGVIVFSGDKRFVYGQDKFDDSGTKIARLGSSAVGGATGATRHIHPETGEVQRDVHAQLAAYFADRELTSATLSDFKNELTARHDEFMVKHATGPATPRPAVFSIVTSSLENGSIVDRYLVADMLDDGKLSIEVREPNPSLRGCIKASGDAEICDALEYLPEELEQLREDDFAAQLLTDPGCDYLNLSIEQAAQICRLVHRVTAERFSSLWPDSLPTISLDCDVFAVDGDGVRVL